MEDIYKHKESNYAYKLIENDGVFCIVKRFGDGKEYTLPVSRFNFIYVPVTDPNKLTYKDFDRGEPVKIEEVKPPTVGKLVETKNVGGIDTIILNDEVKKDLKLAIHKVNNREDLMEKWGLNTIPGFDMGSYINLYGPPGTGKTISAQAIAKELGKNLLIVDYSQIISKWVGETGKQISKIFQEAQDNNCVIFFDEADSLLSKRIAISSDTSNSVNQNRNILMQEMDRYKGVMIFATNLFGNYDEAINRRIAQHVEFKLPDLDSLKEIIKAHIPKKTPKGRLHIAEIASKCIGLSGGDIRNVCLNAIFTASMASEKKLTQSMIDLEVEKMLKSKKSAGTKVNNGREKKVGLL